jgi:hypothetical protein
MDIWPEEAEEAIMSHWLFGGRSIVSDRASGKVSLLENKFVGCVVLRPRLEPFQERLSQQ